MAPTSTPTSLPSALPALQGPVALIGAGLIGGSFALGLRAARPDLQVRVFDHHPDHVSQALACGIASLAAATLAEAVAGAQLVVLAVPVGALPALFAELEPWITPGMVITDVGSTKADVCAAARVALADRMPAFVPGHPIAGAERSGPAAATSRLFDGRRVVLCPQDETDPAALSLVQACWEACGATVHRLPADQHDQVFAAVSHLPHLLSYALVAEFAGRPDGALLFSYAAGGFRDFTRIAASHPAMWRDIALANQQALLGELDAYVAALQRLRQQVAERDGAGLFALFDAARTARVRWGEEQR